MLNCNVIIFPDTVIQTQFSIVSCRFFSIEYSYSLTTKASPSHNSSELFYYDLELFLLCILAQISNQRLRGTVLSVEDVQQI